MRLGKIKEVVIEILETTPSARNDDMVLYALVCRKFNPQVRYGRFDFVLVNHAELSIPNFESVGRCRRRVQAQRPDLQSSEEVQKIKAERIEEFKAFSKA